MPFDSKSHPTVIRFENRVMGWLLVALFFVSGLAASSESFHKLLHHDSEDAGHSCMVSVLSKQALESTQVGSKLPPLPSKVAFVLPEQVDLHLNPFAVFHRHGRAPPAWV